VVKTTNLFLQCERLKEWDWIQWLAGRYIRIYHCKNSQLD